MSLANRAKIIFLVLGDLLALYASLFLTLVIRYGGDFYSQFVNAHFVPFTIIFFIWILIFYIAGLYELRRLRNNMEFLKVLFLTLAVNALIAVFFFYFFLRFVSITPRTNLFIFIGVFAVVEVLWRRQWNAATAPGEAPNKVLLLGESDTIREIASVLKDAPQLGYELKAHRTGDPTEFSHETLHALVRELGINVIVIPSHLKKSAELAGALYTMLTLGLDVRD